MYEDSAINIYKDSADALRFAHGTFAAPSV